MYCQWQWSHGHNVFENNMVNNTKFPRNQLLYPNKRPSMFTSQFITWYQLKVLRYDAATVTFKHPRVFRLISLGT